MASKKQLTHSTIYYEGSLRGSSITDTQYNTDTLLLQTANKYGVSFKIHTNEG